MNYSFINLAKEVIRSSEISSCIGRGWKIAEEKGLIVKLSLSGKVPIKAL